MIQIINFKFDIIIMSVLLLFLFINAPIPAINQEIGFVATPDSHATNIAKEILSKGGNAIDAGVAAMFTLAVVEPFSTGLGGGGILIVYDNKKNETKVIDFREAAPLNIDARIYYQSKKDFEFSTSKGWGSICVPGMVAGANKAIQTFGTKSFDQILNPVIELAENGFSVSESLSKLLTRYYNFLEADKNSFELFFPNWLPLNKGEIMRRENFALTFKLLADQGADIFYRGEIADKIVQQMQMNKGLIVSSDLSEYQVELKQTVKQSYKTYEIHTAPPPSSAGVAILDLLKILEKYDLQKFPLNSGQYIHLFVEACKLVFEDRSKYLSDGIDNSTTNYGFPVSDKHITRASKLIDSLKVRSNENIVVTHNDISNGAHISIIDKFGNAVAISLSLNGNFGSGITLENYSILFNNAMNNFSREANNKISIKAGRRPPISLAPTFLMLNQKPYLVIGGSGGERLISTLAQIIINIVEFKLSLDEAISSPRFYYNYYDHTIEMESRIDSDSIEYLKRLGHKVKLKNAYDVYFGNIQALLYNLNQQNYQFMNDMRKEGVVFFN
ncbi:gamma-glutamyltransferase [candidate division KSB1 bacterium]|nr:gamma-glutamyltransferase [candidate division KSB1 bacterium]